MMLLADLSITVQSIFDFIQRTFLYDDRRIFAVIMGIIALMLLVKIYKDQSEDWRKTLRDMFELAISVLLFIRMY